MGQQRAKLGVAAGRVSHATDEGAVDGLALLNQVSDAVVSTDADFLIQTWNKAAERIYGWTMEDALGRNVDELLRTEFVSMTRAEAEAELQSKGEAEVEVLHQHREGRKLRLHARISLKRNRSGEITGTIGILRDVTERRAAEQSIRENEERLRLAVLGGDLGIWDWHIPTDHAVLSERYYEMIGYKRGEVRPGWNFFKEHIHADDFETVSKTMEAQLAGTSDSSVIEFRLRKKTGEYRWIRGVGKVVTRDAKGAPIRMTGVIADIGPQKEAEQQLRDSREFTQSALDSLSANIAILDDQGTIIAVNRSWRDFAQQNASEAAAACEGVNYFKVCEAATGDSAPFAQAFAKGIREVISGRTGEFQLEYPCHSPSDKRWFNGRVRRLLSNGPIRVVICHEDISLRRLAEEALREREARLALALEHSQMGMWEWNVLTDESVWNAREFELIGLKPEERKSSASLFLSYVHPEDIPALEQSLQAAKESCDCWKHEFRIILADGSLRWLAGAARFVRGSDGQVERMIGVNYDITQQRQIQLELERLVAERTAKLEEMMTELEHFSHAIIHDLRAPLRAMQGFAELAKQSCSQFPEPELHDYLRRISTSANRMDTLITDALNFSRAVREELPIQTVDLAALLRGMIETYPELQANQAHIRLEGAIPSVMGNSAGLVQCFSNLLRNAITFVAPGKIPEVRVWAEPKGKRVRIWIEDNGVGIPESFRSRLFQMFSRGHAGGPGNGIGLALVRKIAKRMNGNVGAESTLGKGSRFWIELKLGEPTPTAPRPNLAAGLGTETILYVEDEESDAFFMQRAFAQKQIGGKLRLVNDGQSAINYLLGAGDYANRASFPLPSVVLLDLNLPQVTGFDVLRWIRNNPEFMHIPVMMFSSSIREDDRLKAMKLGANDFLTKPSSGLDFDKVVEKLQVGWLKQTNSRVDPASS